MKRPQPPQVATPDGEREMLIADIAKLRKSLISACNATDGGCAESASNDFLSHVGQEVGLCINILRRDVSAQHAELITSRLRLESMSAEVAALRDALERISTGDASSGAPFAAYEAGRNAGPAAPVIPEPSVPFAQADPVAMFNMQGGPRIPWPIAEVIYEAYSALYGTGQSLQRLHDRGGFGWSEVTDTFDRYRSRFTERKAEQLRDRVIELYRAPTSPARAEQK